mgnify:CR=1 FL=1
MPDEPTSLIEAPCGCSLTWDRALNRIVHYYCPGDRDYALSPRTSIVRHIKDAQNSVEIGEDAKGTVYVKSAKVYADDPLEAARQAWAAFKEGQAQGKKEDANP